MRRIIIHCLLVGLMIIIVGYLGMRLHEAREAARQASGDLQACQLLADKIKRVSASPKKALEEQRSLDDLSSRIEQAATTAKLARGVIARILPQSDRRLGDSPYVAQPTRVECRDVGLRELVFFINELLSGDKTLHATAIRLSTPLSAANAKHDSESWNAEFVLTHVLYSPNSAAK